MNEEVESSVRKDVESLDGREGRGLADWFGWGGSPATTEPPVRRIQGLQRRTSQVEVKISIKFGTKSASRLLPILLSSAGKLSRAPTAKNIGQQQKQTETEEIRTIKTAPG